MAYYSVNIEDYDRRESTYSSTCGGNILGDTIDNGTLGCVEYCLIKFHLKSQSRRIKVKI